MRLKSRIDQILLVGAALILVLMMVSESFKTTSEASKNPSSGSDSASGVSAFYDLKNRLQSDSAVSVRRAFFSAKDFEPYTTVFLLSPKRDLTPTEDDLLIEWVRRGGKLVVSFQDEETYKKVKPYLEAADIKAFVGESPNYLDGTSVKAEALTTHSFYQAGETYEFYSRLRFQDDACFKQPADCYVREGILGKGGVIAIAGLVPFSNALIGRADNARLASRLALATSRSQFSDYHLLETEKTYKDFLFDPALWLPFGGLLIGVFLFFFAGGGEYETQRLQSVRRRPARSFHALNRQILHTVMLEPGSLPAAGLRQAAFLKRLVGASLSAHERDMLAKITSALTATGENHARTADQEAAPLVQRLILFHKNWLKSRGRSE